MEILLNKNKSKKSNNVNNSLSVNLNDRKRMLPTDGLNTSVDEIDLYNQERILNNNKIRLTCEINTICSNVLFNPITEIVYKEGSDECKCLNFLDLDDDNQGDPTNHKVSGHVETIYGNHSKFNLIGKEPKDFSNKLILTDGSELSLRTLNTCIRDTQLSNIYDYYCGLDIFNNHILRNRTFKSVVPLSEIKKDDDGKPFTTGTNLNFNTIADYLRDSNYNNVIGYLDTVNLSSNNSFPSHLYLAEDVYTFEECVANRLIEKDGWFGFQNKSNFDTLNLSNNYSINKVINNRRSCDFIDMYPSRKLYSFVPIYNSYRKRLEKNWNYYITYPYSSSTNFNFIINDGLKIFKYETNTTDISGNTKNIISKNGFSVIKITTETKHGLSKNNKINLYRLRDSDDLIRTPNEKYSTNNPICQNIHTPILLDSGMLVVEVIDDYSFYIKKTIEIAQNKKLFFKRVINGEEVNYYVRCFQKLPNWKFARKKPSAYNLYNNINEGQTFIEENMIEFENHIGQLAYSKNVYNDDIAEIVFSDDIDISNLRDNLGRPLTSIYLTILKNNKGNHEWYNSGITSANTIEYSHCFSDLCYGFECSEDVDEDVLLSHVLKGEKVNDFTKVEEECGEECYFPYQNRQFYNIFRLNALTNEKCIVNQSYDMFYGDLCCYSNSLLQEIIIQPICYRFNSQQRDLFEVNESNNIVYDWQIVKDNLKYDDYDGEFVVEPSFDSTQEFKTYEGYYYYPHFEIPIKTFDVNIKENTPLIYMVKSVSKDIIDSKIFFTITLYDKCDLNKNDEIKIKLKQISGIPLDVSSKNIICDCSIIDIINQYKIQIETDKINEIENYITNEDDYMYIKLLKKDPITPFYATLSNNGSDIYRWREIIPNGFDNNSDIETYPFTNGSLYVNKTFNLYLKRQDPSSIYGLRDGSSLNIDAELLSPNDENNYYNADSMQC